MDVGHHSERFSLDTHSQQLGESLLDEDEEILEEGGQRQDELLQDLRDRGMSAIAEEANEDSFNYTTRINRTQNILGTEISQNPTILNRQSTSQYKTTANHDSVFMKSPRVQRNRMSSRYNKGIQNSEITEESLRGVRPDILTLDQAYMRAGGFGRFQCLMVLIVSIAFASGSHIMYATNYLMQQPAYLCKDPTTLEFTVPCTQADFCDPITEKPIKEFQVDWSSPSSFENWVIQLNIQCDMDLSNKDNMILVSLIGQFFGQLFLSWLSDLYGRRPYFFFSLLSQIPFQVIAMYSRRLELTYFMYFFLGGCYVGRYFGAFVNISDYVDKRYRNALCTYLLALDCMVQMGVVLHFKYWKGNSFYLEASGIILNTISLFGIWWLPESPEYLYGMHRFRHCRESLQQIAKVNGKIDKIPTLAESQTPEYLFDVEQDFKKISLHQITAGADFKTGFERQTRYNMERKIKVNIKKSLKELFKSKRYKVNLGISIWLWMAAQMGTQIITNYTPPGVISSDSFNVDVFNASIDLWGYLATGLIFAKIVSRKKFIFSISYLFALVGLIGIFRTFYATIEPYLTWSFISKALSQFGAASATQGNFLMMEIFPSVFQATSFGICNAFGVLSQMFVLKLLPLDFTVRLIFGTVIVILCLILSPLMIGSHHIKL
ncbi:hypothetical protein FGO68_gene950 [Halteria grandinella]|uniref:Uncharacterized protein n=1 Tax=Halteria grandinella TaxID=5974 RepID=A0A8J8T512_HALGN|nr:hypothetical protein FGO68_gene950 [Halteria grandinella]